MATTRTVAVVGAALAGAKAAEAARDLDPDSRVLLVGAEAHPPYERPPLSKAVLRGEAEPASAAVHPPGFYEERRIERVHAEVTELDPLTRRLRLASGEPVGYDTVVLATGASPRRLDVPGGDLAGVHYLRTIDDSERLRAAIRAAGRVAVLGAGWIGTEVAASARSLGAEVVLVDPAPTPLHRVLGATVGDVFAALHADHGVALRLGTGVAELRGSGSVESVVLSDGRVEPADVVVVGVGVTPNVGLAVGAGLKVDDGVVVDESLQASAPGVFAAGDVANAWHPLYGRHLRVEHWANALNQGSAAGRAAAGEPQVYDRVPYFYSDQYDLGMEYVGLASPADSVAVRGDLAGRTFLAFWHRDGRVTAAMNVNVWDVVDDLKALLLRPDPVDLGRLTDPDVALADLR